MNTDVTNKVATVYNSLLNMFVNDSVWNINHMNYGLQYGHEPADNAYFYFIVCWWYCFVFCERDKASNYDKPMI